MKISFTDKILESEHPALIISDKMKKLESSIHNVNSEITKILKEFVKIIKIQALLSKHFLTQSQVRFLLYCCFLQNKD